MPERKRILIVEDEENAREALSIILELEGFEATTAGNGRDALNRLQCQPDLILLDLIMPEMDGWEFLRQKRKTPAAGVPVFVLSASDENSVEAEAFFRKPINVDELLRAMRSHFEIGI